MFREHRVGTEHTDIDLAQRSAAAHFPFFFFVFPFFSSSLEFAEAKEGDEMGFLVKLVFICFCSEFALSSQHGARTLANENNTMNVVIMLLVHMIWRPMLKYIEVFLLSLDLNILASVHILGSVRR